MDTQEKKQRKFTTIIEKDPLVLETKVDRLGHDKFIVSVSVVRDGDNRFSMWHAFILYEEKE